MQSVSSKHLALCIDACLYYTVVHKSRYALATFEFNTIDFVIESRPCRFGPVHTGDKVERTFDILGDKVNRVDDSVDRDKLSNLSCCRFVAKTGYKVDRISNKVNRFGDSQLCCQCVPGLKTPLFFIVLQFL